MKMKVKNKKNRRSLRKTTHPLQLQRVALGPEQTLLSQGGTLVEVSETGFKILLDRKEFPSSKFRSQLDLNELVNELISIHIEELDLIIQGTIQRTQFLGKGIFEIGVDYSDTAPEYWRECLVDLLPHPNEID